MPNKRVSGGITPVQERVISAGQQVTQKPELYVASQHHNSQSVGRRGAP